MKTLFSLVLILTSISLFAQAPQRFKYQTVVRDDLGQVIENQNVSLRISILSGSMSGPTVYQEEHSVTTNDFGLVNLEIGDGTVVSGDFTTINWGNSSYFVQVELDETGGTTYQIMGVSQLLSVPYAMYANNAGIADSTLWKKNNNNIFYNEGNVGIGEITPTGKLIVKSDSTAAIDDVIFSVLNLDGDTVLAVYQEGVRIWVTDDTTSGTKASGSRGGFAVGGFSPAKGMTNEYLRVTPDSVRVYIEENTGGTKASGSRGGFAVGGFNPAKGYTDYYLNVEYNDDPEIIDPSKPRVLWYPYREAFRSGKVLIQDVDSVGINSMATGNESQAIGDYSQAFGFKTRAFGHNSTAIGDSANAIGNSSYAFGNNAISVSDGSYAIGSGAKANGVLSFAVGSIGLDSAGTSTNNTLASGNYSYAFGMGSQSTNNGAFSFGTNNISSGQYSLAMGYNSQASDWYAVAIGKSSLASGDKSIAIGYESEASGDYSSIAIGYSPLSSGFGSIALGFMAEAGNNYSIAIGRAVASGSAAIAIGEYAEASDYYCNAIGRYCEATGLYATGVGYGAKAFGSNSVAFGNGVRAEGFRSGALGYGSHSYRQYAYSYGYNCNARAEYSSSLGIGTETNSYHMFVVGSYNDTTLLGGTYDSWQGFEPVFVVGNGQTSASRSNAFIALKNGYLMAPQTYNNTVGPTNRQLYIDNQGYIGYLSSAKKYKSKIKNMENIDWIYDLRPVNYHYKSDKTKTKQYGLIAEDVESINPLFVSYGKNGELETVNYSGLITPMLKAIQDQQKEIDALKSKIKELESTINVSVQK